MIVPVFGYLGNLKHIRKHLNVNKSYTNLYRKYRNLKLLKLMMFRQRYTPKNISRLNGTGNNNVETAELHSITMRPQVERFTSAYISGQLPR